MKVNNRKKVRKNMPEGLVRTTNEYGLRVWKYKGREYISLKAFTLNVPIPILDDKTNTIV